MWRYIKSSICDNCLNEKLPVAAVKANGTEARLCMRCLVSLVSQLHANTEGTVQDNSNDVIWFTSGYGGNTQKAFITMESNHLDMPVQMGLEVAKELLGNLSGAIEGAETDAFIVEYFTRELRMDRSQVAMILMGFRTWREKHP